MPAALETPAAERARQLIEWGDGVPATRTGRARRVESAVAAGGGVVLRRAGGQPDPFESAELDRIHRLFNQGRTAKEIAVMLRRNEKKMFVILGPQLTRDPTRPFVRELLDEVVAFITEHKTHNQFLPPHQRVTYNDLAKHCGYKTSGAVVAWIENRQRPPDSVLKPIQEWLTARRAMLETDPPDRTVRRIVRRPGSIRGAQSVIADVAIAILKERGLKCFTASDSEIITAIQERSGFNQLSRFNILGAALRYSRGRFYMTFVYRNAPRPSRCLWLAEYTAEAIAHGTGQPASTNGFKPGNEEWRDENAMATRFKRGHKKLGGA